MSILGAVAYNGLHDLAEVSEKFWLLTGASQLLSEQAELASRLRLVLRVRARGLGLSGCSVSNIQLLNEFFQKIFVEVAPKGFTKLNNQPKLMEKMADKNSPVIILTAAKSAAAVAAVFLLCTPANKNLICQMMAFGSWN